MAPAPIYAFLPQGLGIFQDVSVRTRQAQLVSPEFHSSENLLSVLDETLLLSA